MYVATVDFVLLGAVPGAATQIVGMLNGLLKYNSDSPMATTLQKWLPLTLAPLGMITCKKALDVLPLAAICGRMLAFRATDEFVMRLLLPAALLPWIPYSVALGSYSSLLAALLSIALGVVALLRFHGKELKEKLLGSKAKAH